MDSLSTPKKPQKVNQKKKGKEEKKVKEPKKNGKDGKKGEKKGADIHKRKRSWVYNDYIYWWVCNKQAIMNNQTKYKATPSPPQHPSFVASIE